jgi:tungstate transport system permease protein
MDYVLGSFYGALLLVSGFDPEVYFVVWISIEVATIAICLAALVGVPLGMLIALKQFPGRQGVIVALNTSMALPTVVVGLVFYAFLSRRGPLGELGLLFTPGGMSAGLFALALPLVTNLVLAAIKGLDSRLFLTCKTLGGTSYQQAWMILKEARFGVMAAIVIGFGRVISEVGIAMMLGGNIKGFTRTMTTAIALETSKGEFEMGLALGVVLLTVAFAVNGVLFILQRTKS